MKTRFEPHILRTDLEKNVINPYLAKTTGQIFLTKNGKDGKQIRLLTL
jgi:hypothetical protein